MLCPWESPSEAACWAAPANPSLWSSFITPYSAFPFLCLPSAHPFIFSILSPPSSRCPFRLFPIFILSLFYFFVYPSFPISPFPPLPFILSLTWFSSPNIILLLLWGSHCYLLTLDHPRAHIKTQHETDPWREGNREWDVFSFPWLKQLFHG